MKALTQEKVSRWRRFTLIALIVVAALALLVFTPAIPAAAEGQCRDDYELTTVVVIPHGGQGIDRNGNGFVCQRFIEQGPPGTPPTWRSTGYKDDD